MARFVRYDWDPLKASANRRKHGVTFEEACLVFGDPLALTIADDDHSLLEDRWITMGMAGASKLLLVVHTETEYAEDEIVIRIISARVPTASEKQQYRETR